MLCSFHGFEALSRGLLLGENLVNLKPCMGDMDTKYSDINDDQRLKGREASLLDTCIQEIAMFLRYAHAISRCARYLSGRRPCQPRLEWMKPAHTPIMTILLHWVVTHGRFCGGG